MKTPFALILSLFFSVTLAQAYPDLNQPVGTDGLPLKVYKDHDLDLYWYIPTSIEPWSHDSRYSSTLYQTANSLSFIFRGQASVDEDTLNQLAQSLNIPRAKLTPIAYDESKDLICQNIYASDPNTTWLFPKQIGNYLEVLPISFRTTNPQIMDEAGYLIQHGGLACTVSVSFKAQTIAYHAILQANLDEVYTRFEMAAHAEYWFFEVDIHTLLQKLVSEGKIKITLEEDTTLPQTILDQKMQAAFDDAEKRIIEALFTPALKLPDGPMAGRGKAFSLRLDYRKSTENKNWNLELSSSKLISKDSQISIRMATR